MKYPYEMLSPMLLSIFSTLFVIVVFFPMGVKVGKEEGRNEMRQEIVEQGYGAWVLTNGSKVFIWNEQRWLYKMDGVKYQTDFSNEYIEY